MTLAVQRDHITALCDGGTDAPDNVQGLCVPCHDAKTQAEALRGRRSGRGADGFA